MDDRGGLEAAVLPGWRWKRDVRGSDLSRHRSHPIAATLSVRQSLFLQSDGEVVSADGAEDDGGGGFAGETEEGHDGG